MTNFYRQGDVVLKQIETLPEGSKPRKDIGDVVLKFGTATGHSHRIRTGAVVRIAADNKEYLEVTKKSATLIHDEHSTIQLPKGVYEILQQREHTAAGIRNVTD